jgi:hypothetical protein
MATSTGWTGTRPHPKDDSHELCTGCKQPINDRYLLKILSKPWHVECVKCSDCQELLNEKCYTRDFKLFCRADYFKHYGTKCHSCKEGLCPEDVVRKTVNGIYHVKCFVCSMCKRELETGEQIYLVQGEKFVCEADYIKSVQAVQQNTAFAMPQVSTVVNPQSSDNQSVTTEASVEMPPVGVGKGRKGSRTMLTSSQLQKLNQVYEYEPRPTKETKSALAKATGLEYVALCI